MIVLGVDPGTATTGFGIIKMEDNRQDFKAINFGVITTKPNLAEAERLYILSQDLQKIIKKYKPDRAGVEKLFFATNQKTAIAVAQARGVALLVCQQRHLPIFEFTPLQVKQTVCGYGQADKKQIQFMVKERFKLSALPKPDDAADALAIALCAALARSNAK